MVLRLWVSRLLRHQKAQLLLVNLLTFGLEVCLAAGITYAPPLLLEVGVEEKFMTMVLGESPVPPALLFQVHTTWNQGSSASLCPQHRSQGEVTVCRVGAAGDGVAWAERVPRERKENRDMPWSPVNPCLMPGSQETP